MKTPNEIVAVKCEGPFTEWYSPFYKEPFNDNDEYRAYYEEHIMDKMPVIGPSLGDTEEEFLSGCLDFLSDRMMCAARNWQAAKERFEFAVEEALNTGNVVKFTDEDCGDFVITPFRRKDMPKVNEEHLKVYGPYADLIRNRVEEI